MPRLLIELVNDDNTPSAPNAVNRVSIQLPNRPAMTHAIARVIKALTDNPHAAASIMTHVLPMLPEPGPPPK